MRIKRLHESVLVRQAEQVEAFAAFSASPTLENMRKLVFAIQRTYAAAQCLKSEVESKVA